VEVETHSATEFSKPEWEVREGTGKRLDVVIKVPEACTVPMESERIGLSLECSSQPTLHPRDTCGGRGGGGRDDGVSFRLEGNQVRVPHVHTLSWIHRGLAILVDSAKKG
jgi:hypothetical protein